MKTISLTAVKLAALLNIELNGYTTSLDVKNLLREQDVFATQDQVSDLLKQAADELPLDTVSNGVYNTYRLPDPAVVASDDSIPSATTINAPKQSFTYTTQLGLDVIGHNNVLQLNDRDWIVTVAHSGSDTDNLYFDSRFTRDQVRQAYAHIKDVKFHDVRARRY